MTNPPDGRQPNILVVDDFPANLQLLRKALLEQNYKVRPVTDGALALQAAQTEPPDLILLDILMPEMDGWEVCRRLKADPTTADIPIIFLTGLEEPEDKVRGFAAGGVDYVTKPLNVPEVLARVKTHLTLASLQRQLKLDNELLEQRVQARTAQLTAANRNLQAEIEQRQQHQQEKDKLLEVVRRQSEQQRTLTLWLMEMQQQKQHTLAQTLQGQTEQRLALLRHNLELIEAMVANSEFVSPNTAALIARQAQDSLDLLARTEADLQTVATDLNQPAPEQSDPTLRLTGRELEVLQLLAGGKSVGEIADLLYISPPTVYGHRRSLMDKLGVDNLPELLLVAARHGLTP